MQESHVETRATEPVIRDFDWSSTVLGAAAGWPQSLRCAFSICLGMEVPSCIFWGAESLVLYNEPWRALAGVAYAGSLGCRAQDVWPETWVNLAAVLETIVHTGETACIRNTVLHQRKPGNGADRRFDLTLTPIIAENTTIVGVYGTAAEIAGREYNSGASSNSGSAAGQQPAPLPRAEEDLELLNFVLNRVREAAYLIDEEAQLRYVNDECCRALGYGREELLSLTIPDIWPDYPVERWREHWRELREGDALKFEARHRAKDGHVFPVEISASYFEYGGKPYSLALAHDIALREQATRQHEAHLQFFTDMNRINRIMQSSTNIDRVMHDVLDAMLSIFLCDRAWLTFPCDPDADTWRVPMERTRPEFPGGGDKAAEIPMTPEIAAVCRVVTEVDGPVTFISGKEPSWPQDLAGQFGFQSFIAMCLRPKTGRPWMFGMHQCTHRREWSQEEQRLFREIGRRFEDALTGLLAYRNLRESELRYREVFEHGSDGIFLLDVEPGPQFRFAAINPAMEAFFSISASTVCGHMVENVMPASLAKVILPGYHRCLTTGQIQHFDEALELRTGTKYLDTTLIPVLDETGAVYRLIGIARDVTESKLAQEVLAAREREFRMLAENTPDYIVRWNRECRRTYVNPAFAEALGTSTSQLIGLSFGAAYPANFKPAPGAVERLGIRIRGVLDSGKPDDLELLWVTPTGEREFHLRLVPERGPSGEVVGVLGIGRDVTEIKESERRFRTLAENSPDAIARFDRSGRYLYVNPSLTRLLDVPASGLIGTCIGELRPGHFDPNTSDNLAALRDAINKALETRTGTRTEFRLTGPGEERHFDAMVVPESDITGEVTSILTISHDVTLHKKAEQAIRELNLDLERRVQERTTELAVANKELETFAYSVSHDLKAPLRWIEGYGRLLQEQYTDKLDSDGQLFISNVRRATVHMNSLIDDLLSYSRMERRNLNACPVAVDELAKAVVDEFADELLESKVDLRFKVPAMSALADREGLMVVLRNLLSNALKFSRTATPPLIEIGALEDDAKVLLWVRDNGIGFDMKFHDRIFDIFQRLQRVEKYPGTGIGLALVRKAVQRMGGRIRAESAPDEGATFYLELPK